MIYRVKWQLCFESHVRHSRRNHCLASLYHFTIWRGIQFIRFNQVRQCSIQCLSREWNGPWGCVSIVCKSRWAFSELMLMLSAKSPLLVPRAPQRTMMELNWVDRGTTIALQKMLWLQPFTWATGSLAVEQNGRFMSLNGTVFCTFGWYIMIHPCNICWYMGWSSSRLHVAKVVEACWHGHQLWEPAGRRRGVELLKPALHFEFSEAKLLETKKLKGD